MDRMSEYKPQDFIRHTNESHVVDEDLAPLPATQALNLQQQQEPELELEVCSASVVFKHERMMVSVAGLQQARGFE